MFKDQAQAQQTKIFFVIEASSSDEDVADGDIDQESPSPLLKQHGNSD